MPDSLVSVIIPSFNCEPFIREAINSVLAQTYNPIEIIVVNNSERNSAAVDSIFNDLKSECPCGKKLLLVHSPNSGPSDARNCGISISSGSFIHFLDGDDILFADKIETHFRAFSTTNELSYTDFRYFAGNDSTILFEPGFRRGNYSGNIFWQLLDEGNFIAMDSVLIPRDAVFMAGGVQGNMLEDWYLWIRLSLLGFTFCYIDTVKLLVRKRSGSTSSCSLGMAEGRVEVLINTLNLARGHTARRQVHAKLGHSFLTLAIRQLGLGLDRQGAVKHLRRASSHYLKADKTMIRRDLQYFLNCFKSSY